MFGFHFILLILCASAWSLKTSFVASTRSRAVWITVSIVRTYLSHNRLTFMIFIILPRFSLQASPPIILNKCHLYSLEGLMKQTGGGDSMSVGMRLPNGTYERPIPGKRVFWIRPGSNCKVKLVRIHYKRFPIE